MPKIEDFLPEVVFFFEPLAEAVSDPDHLVLFFQEFGYDIQGSNPNGLIQTFNAINPSLSDAFTNLVDAVETGSGVIEIAQEAFLAFTALTNSSALQSLLPDSGEFSQEVFDYLTRRYLGFRLPIAVGVLQGLGVLVERRVTATDPDGRDVDYRSIRLEWARFGDFIRDNQQWAYDVYGWGGAPSVGDGRIFNHQLAIARLVKLIETTQLATTHVRELTAADLTTFLKNHGPQLVFKADLPLLQENFADVTPTGDPIFDKEAGLSVLPFGDLNQPAKLGLAIAPYAMGGATVTQPITDRLTLEVEASGQATGGAFVAMTPDGIQIVNGGAVEAAFEFRFRYERPDGQPVILVGEAAGTRIQTKAILATAGGNLTGDFYVAGGFDELGAIIDVSKDGFLGALIPNPIDITAGTILMGWRTGRGVYFEGGTSLAVTVPLHLELGPITLYEVIVLLDWESDLMATIAITADAKLGPLYALVEEAGIDLTLKPAADGAGILGKYDIGFGFKPPTGYAVALEAAPIIGGGYLSIEENEYRGALALKFESIGFSAFGILNTKLPGGRDGFSLAASIFGEFNLPLGYGFFLTGLGGIIGINRTIDTDALRAVLYAGRMDNILFPQDPIANARTILDDMAAILPACEGQHLFGPVARIGWGVPILVEVKLGVVLEVGREVRILILGGLGCNLPTREAALVSLNMSFFGEIDFAAGTISFDGSLEGSRILAFSVSGDSAIRTGWAPRIEHIASFGGLHPRYPRPAALPDLRRMSINFGTNNPRITLSAYQAASLNSLQFGARAELYAKGPNITSVGQCAAEGHAFFDALVYFNPFAFDVMLGGGLSLLVDDDVLAALGFDLRITGPNTFKIDGRVWVTIFGLDVEFPIRHTWGTPQSLPNATVNAVEALRTALQQAKGFEPIAPVGRSSGATFRDADDVEGAIDPIGGIRFVQRAVPLNVRIEKIGEAQVTGVRAVDVKVFDGTAEIIPAAANVEFVRGHFFSLTESERLRSPAFENHKAGFEFAPDDLAISVADAIEAEYAYEVIRIGEEDNRAAPLRMAGHRMLKPEFARRFMGVTHETHMRPTASLRKILRPPKPVVVGEPAFIRPGQFENAVDAVNQPGGRDLFTRLSDAAFAESNLGGIRVPAVDMTDIIDRPEANPTVANYFAAAQSRR